MGTISHKYVNKTTIGAAASPAHVKYNRRIFGSLEKALKNQTRAKRAPRKTGIIISVPLKVWLGGGSGTGITTAYKNTIASEPIAGNKANR